VIRGNELTSNFQPTGLGQTIFRDRYAHNENETWEEAARRVAHHVAEAEDGEGVRRYGDRFYDQLASNRFMPGGRIWYGAGRLKAQLLNCFVVPTTDSREGWGKTTSDVIVISGLMGGVGINLSEVRPRGYLVRGTGGVTTGAVSLGHLINGVGDVIVGGGGRRMALMLCLDVNHPDLIEFLDAKLDQQQLNNANISVVIPDDLDTNRFVEMINAGEDFPLLFNGVPSGKSVNARWLWDRLVENAWVGGEPGVLNGYLANRMNNIHYAKPLISTNPCGEIWLEEYGSCCLGALVLPRFVNNGKFDWDDLDESVRLGVRFLDDVLTINHYPLPEIQANNERYRRIGLGVMGLHTMLLELGMRYDDAASFAFVDRLFTTIKNTAYDASINLAIEKGPFPGYDHAFLDSGFAKTLKRGIRNKIKEHGIRNCASLTVPPTGTTSLVSGVSSGIEPLPPAVYWRNYFKPTNGGERELTRELVVEESFHKYPDLVQSAIDVPVESHFRMQSVVQKHVDNAVSKTINLAKDFPRDAFGDIWLRYLPQLKGTTVYRYGSRENEPINPVPREEWEQVIAEHGEAVTTSMTVDEFMSVDCPTGSCEIGHKNWGTEETAK
jgi:ribonucleoside-diphosphate reductase alpha chain